jgi:hypothetical protein
MYSLIIFIAGVVLLGLLMPKSTSAPMGKVGGRNGLFFGVFVAVLAASPIFGALFAITIGIEFSSRIALCFSWVGIAAALPASLLLARLSGSGSYEDFWRYLEASSKTPRHRFAVIWAVISFGVFTLGMLAFVLSNNGAGV